MSNTKTRNTEEEQKSPENGGKLYQLERNYSLWFSIFKQNKSKIKSDDYGETLKLIGNFETIQQFWGYYQHMKRPSDLINGCEFFLFQEGIKPQWEDESNRDGGRFVIRLNKNSANRFWEDLILSYIGEQYEANDDICGLVLSIKNEYVVLSVWVKNFYGNSDRKYGVIDWIKKVLDIPERDIEYKDHPREGSGPSNANKYQHKSGYRKRKESENYDDNEKTNN